METFAKERILEKLKHATQLLASPAPMQLGLLPPYVCKADELALDFDHWREVTIHNYGNECSPDETAALVALDEKLEWLTKAGGEYWTEEAVSTSPVWQDVRDLAREVLRAFGWPLETPPSYAHEYISTGEIRNPQRD